MNWFRSLSARGRGFVLLGGLFLLAAAGYAHVLADRNAVLAFNDGNIETALSPTYRFPQALLRQWDNSFFFGIGNRQHPVSFQGLGESLFGPHQYRRLFPALILALVGLGIFWSLRSLRLSWAASALSAAIALLSAPSFHFAMVGLPVRPVAMGFAFLAIGFAARGLRSGRVLPYLLSGACLGLAVSEVADVGALYAITAGLLIVWMHAAAVRTFRGAAGAGLRLALIPVVSGLIAFQTVGVMLRTQVSGVSQGEESSTEAERYEWATQWSLPKAESWSIVAGTYFGAGMQSREAPYWGRVGRSAGWKPGSPDYRNFTLTGWGMGAVCSVLLLGCAFTGISDLRRKTRRFAHPALAAAAPVLAVLSLMLSWGKFFPLYRLLYALPFFSTIRNPEKWNGPFVMCSVLAAALMLDRLLAAVREGDREDLRKLTRALGAAAGLLATVALGVLLHTRVSQDRLLERLMREGYGELAPLAVRHSLRVAWKTLLLLVAAGALCVAYARSAIRWKGRSPAPLAGLLALLAVADLLHADSFFAQPHLYRALLKPNPLVDAIQRVGPDRRLKLLPPRDPLLNNLRLTLLPISGQDLFDPISVSRMPSDYAAFFQVMDRAPVRTWELGAVRFFLSYPGAEDQLQALDAGQDRFIERAAFGVTIVDEMYVPTLSVPPDQRLLRLLEFTGALPKYRWVPQAIAVPATEAGEQETLARLAEPALDPGALAFVHGPVPPLASLRGTDGLRVVADAPAAATLDTRLDAPALLVRAVKYDADWTVTANGNRLDLLRVNGIFQGAVIPAGTQRIEWRYRPPRLPVWAALAGRLAVLLALGYWILSGGAREPGPVAGGKKAA